jgi:hypothetical protein
MLSSDFHSKLETFGGIKKHFMGVFSADTVPKRLKKIHLLFAIQMLVLDSVNIGIALLSGIIILLNALIL